MNSAFANFALSTIRIALSFTLGLSGAFVLYGCAPQLEKESPGLANRGILPLSTSDPYLGSNIFIANEMERSPYLHNFLRTKGGPMAIEVTQELGEFPHMVMFYPGRREVYAAERLPRKIPGQEKLVTDWVIRGPYAIERKDFRELAGMDLAMNGEPLFIFRGKELRFNVDAAPSKSSNNVTAIVLPPTPPPTPSPKPTPAKKKKAPTVVVKTEPTPDIANFKPLNSDQQAINMSKGFAERAENGDVIHTVKGDLESLAIIAKWYTGSAANASEIAKVNTLVSDLIIPVGTRIRVPVKLLKTLKSMPLNFS